MNKNDLIHIPEVKDISFSVHRPNPMKELTTDVAVSFRKDDRLYGVILKNNIQSEIFGIIDITTFTERELIIGCVLATIQDERRRKSNVQRFM